MVEALFMMPLRFDEEHMVSILEINHESICRSSECKRLGFCDLEDNLPSDELDICGC